MSECVLLLCLHSSFFAPSLPPSLLTYLWFAFDQCNKQEPPKASTILSFLKFALS